MSYPCLLEQKDCKPSPDSSFDSADASEHPRRGRQKMTEDAEIIRLNIRHYQELLKLDRHTAETRQRLIELLAEAHAQLSSTAMSKQND
jgi:hypothetical protein